MTGQQLKNSILQMAVQGKLVPQDPNDEPASVLLERIRNEKEQLIKDGKIKKEKNSSIIFRGADNLPYEKVGNNEPVCIADEVPFDIPDSWEWLKHNELFEISGGSQPPKSKFIKEPKENYVRLFQIRDYGNNPLPVYIPISTASKTTVKGDILLARYGASLGKVFWAEDGAYNVAMAKVIPLYHCIDEIIDKEYLFYYYHTDLYRSTVFGNSRSAQAGFNKRDLESMWFPLPPLMEQKRIVAKIKKVLPLVEQYEVAYSEVNSLNNSFPDLLKKSILQEAVQGKLVPQDPNDEPASVLLERIRAEKQALIKAGKIKKDKNESIIFRRDNSHYEKRGSEEVCIDDEILFEVPSSWALIRLNDIGIYRKGPFGSSLTKSMFVPKGDDTVKVYEQKNAIQKDHTLGTYYITRQYYESKMKSFTVEPGDILVSCAGTIGETYVLPEQIELGIINQALMRMTIYAPIDLNYFLMYFDYVLKQTAKDSSKGSAIKNIPPFEIFKKLILPLPPIEEQKRIVLKVRELENLCNLLY